MIVFLSERGVFPYNPKNGDAVEVLDREEAMERTDAVLGEDEAAVGLMFGDNACVVGTIKAENRGSAMTAVVSAVIANHREPDEIFVLKFEDVLQLKHNGNNPIVTKLRADVKGKN